jgi:hypothetical protein
VGQASAPSALRQCLVASPPAQKELGCPALLGRRMRAGPSTRSRRRGHACAPSEPSGIPHADTPGGGHIAQLTESSLADHQCLTEPVDSASVRPPTLLVEDYDDELLEQTTGTGSDIGSISSILIKGSQLWSPNQSLSISSTGSRNPSLVLSVDGSNHGSARRGWAISGTDPITPSPPLIGTAPEERHVEHGSMFGDGLDGETLQQGPDEQDSVSARTQASLPLGSVPARQVHSVVWAAAPPANEHAHAAQATSHPTKLSEAEEAKQTASDTARRIASQMALTVERGSARRAAAFGDAHPPRGLRMTHAAGSAGGKSSSLLSVEATGEAFAAPTGSAGSPIAQGHLDSSGPEDGLPEAELRDKPSEAELAKRRAEAAAREREHMYVPPRKAERVKHRASVFARQLAERAERDTVGGATLRREHLATGVATTRSHVAEQGALAKPMPAPVLQTNRAARIAPAPPEAGASPLPLPSPASSRSAHSQSAWLQTLLKPEHRLTLSRRRTRSGPAPRV